ncbi:MAG TPA: YafY family protein [Burkholderiales bacterium]|nr:YafY family protein [Burkholderiales bacterium]
MRRADRLFRIVQHLRGRRLTTAAFLADRLGVSLRTVYRDVRDLSLSGVPVEGEAGVGYRLKAGFDVPPLMFTLNEIEALAVGARMVEAWGGPVLADSARTAIEKIVAALPADRRLAVEQTRLYAPAYHVDGRAMRQLEAVRDAISGRRVLRLDYRDANGKASAREVWPLALYFWGGTWTVAAWCESRTDFRNFRVDRIGGLEALARRYPDQDGRRLADFLRAMQQRR